MKRLAGNPGKRRLNDAEPQFAVPGRTPSPPAYLDATAAAVWRELGRMLLRAGLFTVVDKYALGMFAAAAGRWMEAEVKVRETGGPVLVSKTSGNSYQNPWLGVANRAWDQMRRMFGEFGLTPAERSRLKVLVQEEELTLVDQLAVWAEEVVREQ